MKTGFKAVLLAGVLTTGVAVGCWALAAFIVGLKQAGWQPAELLRQYLVATGIVEPSHTLVDFYSQIKGVEYLICVAFLVAFPLFYKYVNKDSEKITTKI